MHSNEVRREYADLIVTLLLCNEFNPEDNKALRKCFKLFRRKAKTETIRNMCHVMMKTNKVTPLVWLQQKLDEMETVMPAMLFLKTARKQ